jgi:hypothetical protein
MDWHLFILIVVFVVVVAHLHVGLLVLKGVLVFSASR